MEAKSKFWQKVQSEGINLYDPDAQAGLGPLHLPLDHWLTNAARPHDGGYEAKERGELPAEAKGRIDCIFFITAFLDSRNILEQQLRKMVSLPGPTTKEEWKAWDDCAKRFSELCLAWFAIRGPIGEAAWRT